MSEAEKIWTKDLLKEVERERARQDEKWGEQHHPDYSGNGHMVDEHISNYAYTADDFKNYNARMVDVDKLGWDTILLEEVYEALSELNPNKRIEELIQVAAVAVVWIEDLISRGHQPPKP